MAVNKVRIVCISDTHNAHPSISLPKGDILIHAGDLTNQGSLNEVSKAIDWIAQADFAVKIVVAGNHDLSLDPEYALKHKEGWTVVPADGEGEACRQLVVSNPSIVYLQHSGAVIAVPNKSVTLHVFGSPYSPDRGRQNWAFQYDEKNAESIWNAIPSGVDILITHTPPGGHCDRSRHWEEGGCSTLTKALSRTRPLLHVCGHCHEGRGAEVVGWDDQIEAGLPNPLRTWQDPGVQGKKQSLLDLTGKTGEGGRLRRGKEGAIVNASILANSHGRGKVFNKPVVIDLPVDQHKIDDSATQRQSSEVGSLMHGQSER